MGHTFHPAWDATSHVTGTRALCGSQAGFGEVMSPVPGAVAAGVRYPVGVVRGAQSVYRVPRFGSDSGRGARSKARAALT